MFEIVKHGINIDFIKLRRLAFTLSAGTLAVGLASLLTSTSPVA